MIRIVNVRGVNLPDQRAAVCYVGREFAGWPASRFGNPFRPLRGEPIGSCLDRYRTWLLARPEAELMPALRDLWEECGHGAKPLGCWCVNAAVGDGSPLVCHAQVLGEVLGEFVKRYTVTQE